MEMREKPGRLISGGPRPSKHSDRQKVNGKGRRKGGREPVILIKLIAGKRGKGLPEILEEVLWVKSRGCFQKERKSITRPRGAADREGVSKK